MTTCKWQKVIRLGVLLIPAFSTVASWAAMPSGEFACQVSVEGGRIGLVLVQAETRALAEKAAVGAEAFVTDNTRGRATGVLQCISRADEQFTDYQFQQFFQSVPL